MTVATEPQELARYERLREQLATELRTLRLESGLTQPELAERLGTMSQSKVSKIERGRIAPSIADVRSLVDNLASTAKKKEELVGLARTINTEFYDIREIGQLGLAWGQERVGRTETSSNAISGYSALFVPGLLQTTEFSRGVFTSSDMNDKEIAEAVAARVKRQQLLLHDSTKSVQLLMHETGLLTMTHGISAPVMLAQHGALEKFLVDGNAGKEFAILPIDARTNDFPPGDFTVFDDCVSIELPKSVQWFADPAQVNDFRTVFSDLWSVAAKSSDARNLIRAASERLRLAAS